MCAERDPPTPTHNAVAANHALPNKHVAANHVLHMNVVVRCDTSLLLQPVDGAVTGAVSTRVAQDSCMGCAVVAVQDADQQVHTVGSTPPFAAVAMHNVSPCMVYTMQAPLTNMAYLCSQYQHT